MKKLSLSQKDFVFQSHGQRERNIFQYWTQVQTEKMTLKMSHTEHDNMSCKVLLRREIQLTNRASRNTTDKYSFKEIQN